MKKPKKTETANYPDGSTPVNVQAVAKALSKPRDNKWKSMSKAIQDALPDDDSLNIYSIPVPDSVATGLDAQISDSEFMSELQADYNQPTSGYMFGTPDESRKHVVAEAMMAQKKPSHQPSLFDNMGNQVVQIVKGNVPNQTLNAYPTPAPMYVSSPMPPTNLYKKFRAGDIRTKEPERFPMTDMLDEEVIPSNENDVDMIRQSLVIERVPERMRIIVVVIDKENSSGNDINLIKCNGDPLGCHGYDAQHDGYYVSCAAYTDLGPIPVAYRIKSQGSIDSNNIIALPNELIDKYLSPSQKKTLKLFRDKYPAPRFSMEYMQAITC